MKTLFSIFFACAMIVASVQTSRYVIVPGYAYKTDPSCERRQPPSEFDVRCDAPLLGFSGFTPPPTFGNGL